jgi:hypothetical protein
MYFGPIFLDTKEIFLILATGLLACIKFFHWEIMWFNTTDLLTLTILILITKGLLPAIHNEAFFTLAIVTILLSLWLTIFQVILFFFISFILFRLVKVI